MLETVQTDCVIFDGVREVRLKTTEINNRGLTTGAPRVGSVPACNNAGTTAVLLEVSVCGSRAGVCSGSYF